MMTIKGINRKHAEEFARHVAGCWPVMGFPNHGQASACVVELEDEDGPATLGELAGVEWFGAEGPRPTAMTGSTYPRPASAR
jgi:hypothetical protein